jgi:membrane fusion protein (multidrug efflux system)
MLLSTTSSLPPAQGAANAASAAAPGEAVLPAEKRASSRGILLWALFILIVVAAGAYGWRWWTVDRFVESTNDAYMDADSVVVAPRISGYVSAVLVKDNQAVAAGQPLVRIEPDTYQAALAQQRATLDAREADIGTAEAQIHQQQAQVAEAQARLAGAEVDARYAAHEAERYRGLVANGVETAEHLAEMVNNRDQANATVQTDIAALAAAERQTETQRAQLVQARAQAEAAAASVQSAALDMRNTLIRASIAGAVGDRTVRVGQYVQPGTRLLSVVPVESVYVSANFKETQIADMRIGQAVRISVDALDGRVLNGVVDSFAPGTGAQFALLPPENATGNFTKIVQRVPVRIRIETDDATRARLLPGLSVTVSIDTRDAVQGTH